MENNKSNYTESTSKSKKEAEELLKNKSVASKTNSNIHQFNVENRELLYQEDETSKLVNLSKIRSAKVSLYTQENKSNTDSSTEVESNKENPKKQNLLSKFTLYFKFASNNQNSKILDLTIFAVFAISVYLYILSLAGCNDTQTACLVNLSPQFFHNIVISLSISSIVNSIILFLVIKNAIGKFHLIYIFAVFGYLTLIYDTGSDLAHHGAYNRLVFFLLIFVAILFIYFTNLLVYLIKKKYFKLISFCTVFSLLTIIYISIKISDCSKWNLGLNNKNLLNNLKNEHDKCFISSPQKCWVDFLDGLFDVSWYLQEDCQNFRTGERTELLKYLPKRYKDTFVFGYPITNVWKYVPESFHLPFFYNLMVNYIDIYNPSNNNKTNTYEKNEPEIILRFDEKSHLGNIEINIKKNKTLVAERRLKANKIKEAKLKKLNKEITPEAIENEQLGLVDNVLFIYIDSISRQHFLRKMKNTIKFMEQYFKKIDFATLDQENIIDKSLLSEGEKTQSLSENSKINPHRNNKKDQNEINKKINFNFYQFLKYHAFIYFTQPNANPMFYGESMKHNNGTNIIKHFHDRGFISAQSNNICSRELYDIEPGYIENLTWEPFDHENIALFCDPNYFSPENPFTPYMGPYSIKKRCLYGRNTFEYVLDYGEKFWEVYREEKKFLRVAFQDAHEGTGEVARYLDEYLYLFLKKFEEKNWLENTAIFIVSDHGNNMIGFYNLFNCEDFIKEKTLATWFMLLPDNDKLNKYDDLIMQNENTMVTPYDIFDTLISLIQEKDEVIVKSPLGQSVITELVDGRDRNCKRYELDMLDIWCRCDEI